MKPSLLATGLLLLLLLLLAGAAQAHDSWFERLPDGTLALGTGNQFPTFDSAIGAEYLRKQGCQRADGSALPLTPLRNTDTTLLLSPAPEAVSCWMQLAPFEVELAPDKIALYMSEVHPPQALLDAWAGMQARGLPWKERYTKHARVQRLGSGSARPAEMGMDALPVGAAASPRVGSTLEFQLLRDGAPLPGLAVQFRTERSGFGIWRSTDAQGRVQFQPPLAGAWLLRAVDLRVSATVPDSFDSRFVTLAFEVAPRTAAP